MAEATPTTSPPEWDCTARPRRGLLGYHRAQDAGDMPGAPEALDAASARLHAARTHVLQAYVAVRRYPADPRWGRIDGNPEAKASMDLARLNLRMARDHLRRASAQHRSERGHRAALDRAAWAVREVGHRAMNGFQMIEGLLAAQARRTADPGARAALLVAAGRVRAMAAVQRRLLVGADRRADIDVELGSHLRALCDELAEAFLDSDRIALAIHVERGIMVAADDASAVAMLVTELVVNAAKHAFPGGRRGRITVRLERFGAAGAYRLTIEDDGCGLPAGFNPAISGSGLGVRIAAAMARQVGGSLHVDGTGPGARVVLTVPGVRG